MINPKLTKILVLTFLIALTVCFPLSSAAIVYQSPEVSISPTTGNYMDIPEYAVVWIRFDWEVTDTRNMVVFQIEGTTDGQLLKFAVEKTGEATENIGVYQYDDWLPIGGQDNIFIAHGGLDYLTAGSAIVAINTNTDELTLYLSDDLGETYLTDVTGDLEAALTLFKATHIHGYVYPVSTGAGNVTVYTTLPEELGGSSQATPTPTPFPTTAPDDFWSGTLGTTISDGLALIAPLIFALIPAFIGWKFARAWGFFAGINLGIILCYLFIAGFPIWAVIVMLILDGLLLFGKVGIHD